MVLPPRPPEGDPFLQMIDVTEQGGGIYNLGVTTLRATVVQNNLPENIGGSGTGKVAMTDLHVSANLSKASPQLLLACAAGKHIKSAVLTGRKAGKGQTEFLTFSLSDVLVSGYQTGGSAARVSSTSFAICATIVRAS